jgi:predicted nuclease with TOPRIM domain
VVGVVISGFNAIIARHFEQERKAFATFKRNWSEDERDLNELIAENDQLKAQLAVMREAVDVLHNANKTANEIASERLVKLNELKDLHRWRNYPQEKPEEGQACLVEYQFENSVRDYRAKIIYSPEGMEFLIGNGSCNIRWLPYPKQEEGT